MKCSNLLIDNGWNNASVHRNGKGAAAPSQRPIRTVRDVFFFFPLISLSISDPPYDQSVSQKHIHGLDTGSTTVHYGPKSYIILHLNFHLLVS